MRRETFSRVTGLLLAVVLVLSALVPTGFAAVTTTVNGVTYTLNTTAKTASLTSVVAGSVGSDLIVPPTIAYNGASYTVTGVDKYAFRSNEEVVSVVLPDTITTMGDSVFYYSDSIETVVLPAKLKTLPKNTFYGCSNLKTVILPETLTTINASAFNRTYALEQLTLPAGLTTFSGSSIFSGSAIRSLSIPAGVKALGSSMFSGCSNLETVYAAGGLTALPSSVFATTKLQQFYLPETVTSIASRAFWNCYELTDLYIACDYPSAGVPSDALSDLATLTVHISSKYAANWEAFQKNYYCVNFDIVDENEMPTISAPAAPESYSVQAVTAHATVSGLPETVAPNGSYTFTVAPETGYSVERVTVNGVTVTPDDSGVYTVENVSDAQVVAASASVITHTVTVEGNAKIKVGTSTYSAYTDWAEGTDLTFSVTANSGYVVSSVTAEGGTLTDNADGTYTLSAPYVDTTVKVATTEQTGWVVSFSGGNADIMVDGKAVRSVEVEKGGSLSFSVVAHDHYMVGTVMYVNPTTRRPVTLTPTDGVYTLENISSNMSLNIITTAARYGVGISCGEHVSSSPASGSVAYGATFSFTLTFDEGYELDTITTTSGTLKNGTAAGAYILSGVEQTATIKVTAKQMQPIELDEQQKLLTFKYNADGTAVLSKCPADFAGELTVPAVVQNGSYTYRVTEIGANAFRSCAGLTKVTLPEGLVKLNNYAFGDCTALQTVAIPSTVTTFGDYVFRGCTGLTTMDIPATVTTMGGNTFYGCEALETVTLHEGLTVIPTYTFFGCHALREITIPSTVKEISSYAFSETNLTEVVLPEGLENLGGAERGGRVFQNCYSLEKITLPSTLKILRPYIFYNCESLESVTIPEGLEFLGDGVFGGCTKLKEVNIPSTITEIPSSLCSSCSSLTKVSMSDNVTTIGMLAFANCESLESLHFPAKLETLGNNVFQSCYSLKSVTLPAGLKKIGLACFTVCKSLSSVTFEGNQVTEIGSGAFASSTSLTSITLPDSLVLLGEGAFSNSGITKLHIPAKVRTSDNATQTLLMSPAPYCSNLTEITVDEANAYYKSVDGVLLTKKGNILIQYPAGKADTTYAVPDGVLIVRPAAFVGAAHLTDVTLPETVTTLFGNAFYACPGVKVFDVPAGTQTLNNYSLAFGTEVTDDLGNTTYNTSLEALIFHGDYNVSLKNDIFFNLDTLTVFYPANNTTWSDNLATAQAKHPNVHFVSYDEATQNPRNIHTLTFTTDAHAAAMTTTETPEALTSLTLRESVYSFTVTTDAGYTVASVKAGDTTLTPDENGVYTIAPTADTEITVTSVEAYYSVQFVSADGQAKIYNGKTDVTGRTTRLQYGYSLTLTVVPDEHYEIANATLSTGTLTDNENGTYTLSDISGDAVFTVTTCEKHEHTYELTDHKDATCTEAGYDRYTCSVCENTYDEPIEALGHDYKVSEHKDATCTEAGYDRYTCTRCEDTYDEAIEAIGHDYALADHKDATCTEAGYDRYTCKNCADTYDEAIEALSHSYEVTEHVDPTGDQAGYEVKTCTRCGDTVRTELAASGCPSAAFTDVGENDWFHSAVDFSMTNGLMNGVSSTGFDPYGTATRAMLVTILHRSAGKPEPTKAVPFTDVRAGAWYANAVAWGYSTGVVNGTSETSFSPDANVTREQVAVILYRFAAENGEDVSATTDLAAQFADAADISGYATDAMSWAVATGILNGDGTAVHPQNQATRAELAAMLMRYLSK